MRNVLAIRKNCLVWLQIISKRMTDFCGICFWMALHNGRRKIYACKVEIFCQQNEESTHQINGQTNQTAVREAVVREMKGNTSLTRVSHHWNSIGGYD